MAVTPVKQRIPIDMGLLEILNQRFEQLAADPVVLVNGNVWYNTTQHRLKRVENGVVVPFFSAEDAVKLAAYQTAIDDAQADADAANALIALITDDNLLYRSEKPVIKAQYDLLLEEQGGIDEIADMYGITTEKTNYDNAITALTNYLESLNPLYTDYTQDTVIDGALFRQLFGNVYTTRQILSNVMSEYAYDNLDQAMSVANAAVSAAANAQADATAALAGINAVADDGLLARQEKPGVVQQYNVLVNERAGIDAQADNYVIVAEKTAYDNAVIALTAYMTGMVPPYNDYTQDTIIVRATFNAAFELVYSTRQTLLNAIAAEAKLLADTAAIIARSKGRHFISEPTTPYEVGDLWSNAVDLYRCITEKLTGAFELDDWEVATHYDRTKTVIDGGLITTGRIEVGGGVLGDANAGMNGSVSLTPTTDIRFWAGSNYAGRNTAPWRVQNDGTFYATQGYIGGWHVDSDSMHSGTKVTGNGFSAAPGDVTIKSDGSIHAYKFYINADGTVSFKATGAQVSTTPVDGGNLDGAVSNVTPNEASTPEILECTLVAGSSGYCEITIGAESHNANWNSSLEDTAADFVSSYSNTGYAGIIVSRDGAKLIFTKAGGSIGAFSAVDNGILAMPMPGYTAQYYDAGTAQKDKITLSGTGGMCTLNCHGAAGIVYYNHSTISGDPLTNSAADFVTREAAHFLTHGVILTSVGSDIFVEASVPGVAFSPATASSNIPVDTIGGLTMIGNELFEASSDTNSGAMLINVRGYNGGTSRFRNTYIGDGRGGTIIEINGYFGTITAKVPIAGAPGTFRTGYIYYDGGTLKMT